MKKLFTFMASCLMVLSAGAQNSVTLTFEDSQYQQNNPDVAGYWTSRIDTPQYGGELLYGENHGDTAAVYTNANYRWYDNNGTQLYSELPENYGFHMFWGGGHAISNYWNGNLNEGDYMHQLSVYVPDNASSGQGGHGHNGSDNFCVHFGYMDGSAYNGTENLPFVTFRDSVARYIDSMWINNTTYNVNCMLRGNTLTEPISKDDVLYIEATGYDGNSLMYQKIFSLLKDDLTPITDWTKWNWNSDDENYPVTKVDFNIKSTVDNGYGFSLPAYFAYDDVTVRTPVAAARTAKAVRKIEAAEGEKYIEIKLSGQDENYKPVPLYGIPTGDVPEGLAIEVESDGTMPSQLGKNETRKVKITGLPEGTIITRLAAKVGTMTTAMGAGRMKAFIDGEEVGQIAWCASNMKGVTNDYGQKVGTADDLEFDFYEDAVTTCNESVEFFAENVSIEEKPVLTQTVNLRRYYIFYTNGETTGITELNKANNSGAELYTLQGLRVVAPVKGQVYVKNGKKVIF